MNGDTDETGFSTLGQITAAKAGRLGLAWYVDLPGESSLEAAPIEAAGILYFTGTYAAVYAVDAASGKLLWKFDPKTWEHNPLKMSFNFSANRGAAYAAGRIFFASLDGRLFALDAKTGQQAGKFCIHPDRVGPCNEIFTLSAAEVARARRRRQGRSAARRPSIDPRRRRGSGPATRSSGATMARLNHAGLDEYGHSRGAQNEPPRHAMT